MLTLAIPDMEILAVCLFKRVLLPPRKEYLEVPYLHSYQGAPLQDLHLVLCEYSKFRIESNSYFTIRFDSKPTQLFEIFKYLRLVYTGDLNAIFGDYNGDYSRRKGDKLSPFQANTVAVSATIVAVPHDYSQSPFRATKSPKTATNCRRLGRLATTVAVFANYYRQKLFDSIRNEKPLFAQHYALLTLVG